MNLSRLVVNEAKCLCDSTYFYTHRTDQNHWPEIFSGSNSWLIRHDKWNEMIQFRVCLYETFNRPEDFLVNTCWVIRKRGCEWRSLSVKNALMFKLAWHLSTGNVNVFLTWRIWLSTIDDITDQWTNETICPNLLIGSLWVRWWKISSGRSIDRCQLGGIQFRSLKKN